MKYRIKLFTYDIGLKFDISFLLVLAFITAYCSLLTPHCADVTYFSCHIVMLSCQ